MSDYKCPQCESTDSFLADAEIRVCVYGEDGEIDFDGYEPKINPTGDMECTACGYKACTTEFDEFRKEALRLMKGFKI